MSADYGNDQIYWKIYCRIMVTSLEYIDLYFYTHIIIEQVSGATTNMVMGMDVTNGYTKI